MNTIEKDFFKVRDNITPCIYAYSDSSAGYEGLLKLAILLEHQKKDILKILPRLMSSLGREKNF